MTVALIDTDIVAYRCAAASENEPIDIAILRADKLMQDIIEETESDSYVAYLSGDTNFRKEIYPLYKANRKDVVKPKHLESVARFLEEEWNAITTNGYEADDALGINQTEETIVCSIDKDLLQVPGRHYNFVKKEIYEIDEFEGLRSFYRSVLVGDIADNIVGVKGIGKVKAAKLIDCLYDEKDMYNTCCQLYQDPDRLEINLDCLWIWRNHNERWSNRFSF